MISIEELVRSAQKTLQIHSAYDGRIIVAFEHCDVKDGFFLAGEYGVGNTVAEAVDDYVRKISGKKLVFNAGTKHRTEATFILVPTDKQELRRTERE